jgi:hypothetical protein
MRHIGNTGEKRITGIAQGRLTAIASCHGKVKAGQGFSIENILGCTIEKNLSFALGMCGLMIMDVEPGQKETFRFAVCFYKVVLLQQAWIQHTTTQDISKILKR